jgi:hypothetical protein
MEKGDSGLLKQERGILDARPRQHQKMAVSKPIRVLAAACMALFFFLMLQMMRNPSPVTPPIASPEKEDFKSFVRDPNLDGMKA